MKRFYDFPIRTKLLVLILFASSASLLLAMIAIAFYDYRDFSQGKIRDLQTQAEMLGRTSTAALEFGDAAAATEYLAALNAKPSIVEGALYSARGKLFATYIKPNEKHPFPSVQVSSYHFEDDDAVLFYTVKNRQGELLGTVFLRADMELFDRTANFLAILMLVMLVALGAGIWLATRLQGLVSAPILEISGVAKAVIAKRDYSLRAQKMSEDEIGALADAFNLMLAHIQERDAMLSAVNRSLHAEVEERKQAQDALRRNMQELARSNAELEQFAYVSSHDLQEPLRMVASYTQLLEKRYKDRFDEKGLTFLHYIVDGAKRMQQLIDDLLMFSRVGTRGKELRPLRVEEPFNSALSNLKIAIQESGAHVAHDPLPTVMGDPVQLTQLFQNLIGNAIKFKKPDTKPEILVNITSENEFWLFAVKDNGIGIEKEYFDRIFVIFQRLHARSEYPGSGIGLAICKKIIERHGGRIWIESQPDQGSTFYFTLKKAKTDAEHG